MKLRIRIALCPQGGDALSTHGNVEMPFFCPSPFSIVAAQGLYDPRRTRIIPEGRPFIMRLRKLLPTAVT